MVLCTKEISSIESIEHSSEECAEIVDHSAGEDPQLHPTCRYEDTDSRTLADILPNELLNLDLNNCHIRRRFNELGDSVV